MKPISNAFVKHSGRLFRAALSAAGCDRRVSIPTAACDTEGETHNGTYVGQSGYGLLLVYA